MSDERTSGRYLDVSGASLYHEVAGAGPLLLMIPGGTADSSDFARIAPYLTGHYTVARYDPRGVSRSHLAQPSDVPVEQHAEDARRLLATLGDEPAYVFGSSGGGVIGLALVARDPARVRTFVGHEPPVVQLLPQDSPSRDGAQEVYDVYREAGVGPAMKAFIAFTSLGTPRPRREEPNPELEEALAQRLAGMQQNVEFFLAHYMLPITAYLPDVAALQAASSRVMVGVGERSGGGLAHETAMALADRLGTPTVTFPGGHSGYFTHPEAFAAKLQEVLRSTDSMVHLR